VQKKDPAAPLPTPAKFDRLSRREQQHDPHIVNLFLG
jgi:hypothetical protein